MRCPFRLFFCLIFMAWLCAAPAEGAETRHDAAMNAELADRILTFSNTAQEALAGDYYTLGDVLAAFSQIYREIWQLPRMPPDPGQRPSLRPPRGIFSAEEEKKLDVALGGMNGEIEKIRKDYASLAKYVMDDSIHDDGKRGLAICREIDLAHKRFMRARRTWRAIVDARAASAEDFLLEKHPLRRQIIAARHIFEQMREVSDLLRSGSTNRAELEPFAQSVAALAADAAKPPFPARPGLERLYRAFLREVSLYGQNFQRGLLEGFYAPQKRELGQAMEKCRGAYNIFAREASGALAE